MEILIISVFVLGYILITLEHSIKIDKLIPALGMMGILWAIIALNHLDVYDINLELLKLEPTHIEEVLLHHLGKTAEILIFLLGAMTIVEIIDYFDGFSGIKQVIKTRSKVKILWIFGALAFVLSAIIDNLTATIVLITLLQKLVKVRSLKLWYAGNNQPLYVIDGKIFKRIFPNLEKYHMYTAGFINTFAPPCFPFCS